MRQGLFITDYLIEMIANSPSNVAIIFPFLLLMRLIKSFNIMKLNEFTNKFTIFVHSNIK